MRFIILWIIAFSTFSYGVRGPNHHLKRLASPQHWMLSKQSGLFKKNYNSSIDVIPYENIQEENEFYRAFICFVNKTYKEKDYYAATLFD